MTNTVVPLVTMLHSAASEPPGAGRARLDITCRAATKSAQAGTGAARRHKARRPSEVAPLDSTLSGSEAGAAPRAMSRVPNRTPASSLGAAQVAFKLPAIALPTLARRNILNSLV